MKLALQKKMDMRYLLGKVIKILEICRYHKNNKMMKTLRLTQARELQQEYSATEGENELILNTLLDALKIKNKLWAYIKCRKVGFIFYNELYTFKFWMI